MPSSCHTTFCGHQIGEKVLNKFHMTLRGHEVDPPMAVGGGGTSGGGERSGCVVSGSKRISHGYLCSSGGIPCGLSMT